MLEQQVKPIVIIEQPLENQMRQREEINAGIHNIPQSERQGLKYSQSVSQLKSLTKSESLKTLTAVEQNKPESTQPSATT